MPLITSVRPMLKSDSAATQRSNSTKTQLEIELENWSPTSVDELVSMLLPQVNEPCSCKPWLILLVICASKAVKNESPAHVRCPGLNQSWD